MIMKSLFFYVCLIFSLNTYGQFNLIQDPGFESGSSSNLWGGSSVVNSNQYAGSYAAQLGDDTEWGGGYEVIITGLTANTTYKFSGFVKTSGGEGRIGVKNYGGSENFTSFSNTSYGEQSIVFTTGFVSTKATLFVYNPAGDAEYVFADDLFLQGIDYEYNLIWNDEFNLDGSVDTAKWSAERGFKRNNEAQYYLPDNLTQENGNLVISAVRDTVLNENYDPNSSDWKQNREVGYWTSGSIATFNKFKFLYGRVECRAKVTNLLGTWPAIWTVGEPDQVGCGDWPAGGEIDIMENYQNKILGNFAVAGSGRWNATWNSNAISVDELGIANFADDYHIWTLDWNENGMSIYVDDVLINTFDPNTKNNSAAYACPGSAPFKEVPQILWLNLALGGNSGGSTSALPDSTVYLVDYIRMYQKDSLAPVTPINLIDDSGFESGSSSYLWGGSTVVNSDQYAGTYAALLEDNSQWGGGYEATISGLSPNTTYDFSGFVKTSGGEGLLGVKNYGGSEIQVGFTNTEYIKQNLQFTTGQSSTSATLYVYNPVGGANLLYADNLELIASTTSNARAGQSLLRGERKPQSLLIYPNPATDILVFSLSSEIDGSATISLIDLEGSVIKEKRIELSKRGNQLEIDVSDLKKGFYMAELELNGSITTKRVVIE
ncbi:family 16 glycosylhydrolase [Flammeovirgaceae bacterium SG7u.111]|nr:family 16 glycosylhydrolase [Flammeovirgaceae bacterium SG7u.132]WPO37876.1 family 16 glycosylhydrolase [Flammeovirgaceae bacterium SG7u.111]